jgi:nucleoside-diphosphate-sugar epimerase
MTQQSRLGPESSTPIRTVFVTGAAGYLGSVAVRRFLDAGLHVIGFDSLEFGSHGIDELLHQPRFRLVQGDIRRTEDWLDSLSVSDAVLHLAAVVGDPACAQQPDLATSVNVDASTRLLHEARDNAVTQRFVFASTCSNYGRHPDFEYCDESSDLRPISHYANTKVEMERRTLAIDSTEGFVTTCLRFATAFGMSPRMRFDLTVNEFTRELAEGRSLEVYGSQFWRPYCHTQDIAKACLTVFQAEPYLVANKAFNVGSTSNNHTKQHLIDMLLRFIPSAHVALIKKHEDPRSYRVNCNRLTQVLGYTPEYTVEDGIKEILDALNTGAFNGIPEQALRNSVAA